jgi:tyrosine-specific transport protein
MNKNKMIGGILLVSGTAIGAGMLALPISTASSGFIPSTFAFLLCWFFMTVAALLLLEANLRLAGEKDLISMAGATLGGAGKAIAWVSCLLLLYSLICAYLKGGSAWIVKLLATHQIIISSNWAILGLIFLYGIIISYGVALTEKINRLLMIGLVLAYIILTSSALPSVEITRVDFGDFSQLPATFPLILTSFGFSIILPSLTNYLDRDVRVLRWVIILGGLLPFVVYLLWEFISLGIIPITGDNSLQLLAQSHDDGTGVAVALERIVGNPWITKSSQWFAIFAILTSLLGVSLALFHFLADGLNIKKKKKLHHHLLLWLLTYAPPLAILIGYPSGFSRILSFAGVFVAVLMGVLPALMVWLGRVGKTKPSEYRVWGGRGLLVAVIGFFSYIVYLEIVNCFGCR